MAAGDRLVLQTPGGGGWGKKLEGAKANGVANGYKPQWEARGSLAEKSMAEAAFGA
jgi:5-oxoprolinase (ATP-hydrolysing)